MNFAHHCGSRVLLSTRPRTVHFPPVTRSCLRLSPGCARSEHHYLSAASVLRFWASSTRAPRAPCEYRLDHEDPRTSQAHGEAKPLAARPAHPGVLYFPAPPQMTLRLGCSDQPTNACNS